MAHQLSIRSNGKVEMAYTGETPWHHLGQKMVKGAPMADWIKAAGMDWEIQSAPVQYKIAIPGGTVTAKLDTHKVAFRSDTKAALAVVGDGFNFVQPRETAEFFEEACEKHGWSLETMGCLFGGRQFWALANIGDESSLFDRKDKLRNYMLMSTACDGTRRTELKQVFIRVVCNNTLSATNGIKASFAVSHRSVFDAKAAQKALGMDSTVAFSNAVQDIKALASKRVTFEDAVKLVLEIFHPESHKLSKDEAAKVLKSHAAATVGEMFTSNKFIGSELDGVARTAWGLVNCVTEFVDHNARTKSQDHRMSSAWFGKGDDLKSRAFAVAMAFSN